jgi:hypothetical protein
MFSNKVYSFHFILYVRILDNSPQKLYREYSDKLDIELRPTYDQILSAIKDTVKEILDNTNISR